MNRTKKKKKGGGAPGSAPLDNTVYDIVIIAGQSNAVGHGIRNVCDSTSLRGCSAIDLRSDSELQGPIRSAGYDRLDTTKVKMFTSYFNPAEERHTNPNQIVDMSEPLQNSIYRDPISNGNQISFASSFAIEYLRRISMGSRKLLIVGCAVDGAGIYPNRPETPNDQGAWYWAVPAYDDPTSLYNLTIDRLTNVKNCLSPTNPSKVVAFLWHQGETDMPNILRNPATRINKIDAFKSQLKRSLTGMRTAIMRIFNSNNGGYTYPILLGGLSYDKQFNRITGERNPTEFRKEMSKVISEVSNPSDPYYIPKSAFVSSDYFTFSPRLEGNSRMDASGNIIDTYGDGDHHFSATSMREFGRRYFYYFTIVKDQ
jgi:hypothetical protein